MWRRREVQSFLGDDDDEVDADGDPNLRLDGAAPCDAVVRKVGHELHNYEDMLAFIAAKRAAERRSLLLDGAYWCEASTKGIDAVL